VAVYSDAYLEMLERGPFPGRIDPWAEAGRYFRPIHNEIISAMLAFVREPLLRMGYVAGRENSLQISEGREPDLYVLRQDAPPERFTRWNYALAAAESLAEPGLIPPDDAEWQALAIRSADGGDLVTVVEIVSPTNKVSAGEIAAYQERRTRLYLESGVQVVEIDLTRSVKRLAHNSLTQRHPYHVAVYLPGDAVRVVTIDLGAALPRIALPLRGEVIPLALMDAYQHGYRQNTTAWHIDRDDGYGEDNLPFPSLLADAHRAEAIAAVAAWKSELTRLRV
jgi:hypothetical protein